MILRRTNRRMNERGTIAVAVVIALVMLQLVVVGVVIAGARDHDLTGRRAETMRAFYAAEAGVNMATRELFNAADEDGDGTIGSISGDGNDATDPSLGTARFNVTASTSGAGTTITCRARCGLSNHCLSVMLQ